MTALPPNAQRQLMRMRSLEPPIDLVVMATAGRGRVARFMMGSVTDRVLRAAPCPVLALHPHDRVEEQAPNRAA